MFRRPCHRQVVRQDSMCSSNHGVVHEACAESQGSRRKDQHNAGPLGR